MSRGQGRPETATLAHEGGGRHAPAAPLQNIERRLPVRCVIGGCFIGWSWGEIMTENVRVEFLRDTQFASISFQKGEHYFVDAATAAVLTACGAARVLEEPPNAVEE